MRRPRRAGRRRWCSSSWSSPRSRWLNSSSLPRLRSQPIQQPSAALNWRLRWSRKKRGGRPAACRALRRSTPSSAARRQASSSGVVSVGASTKSVSSAKIQARVGVGEEVLFEPLDQPGGLLGPADQRGHDDEGGAILGDALLQVEPRQDARRQQPADEEVRQGDRDLARRQQARQRPPAPPASPAPRPGQGDDREEGQGGQGDERSEIGEIGVVEQPAAPAVGPGAAGSRAVRSNSRRPSPSRTQLTCPETRVAGVGRRRGDGGAGHADLVPAAAARELLDGAAAAVARWRSPAWRRPRRGRCAAPPRPGWSPRRTRPSR